MTSKRGPDLPESTPFLCSASGISIALRGWLIGASFLITILLANYLGPDSFGRYSLLMSIAILAAGLAQAGAVPLLVRETAKAENAARVRRTVRFTLTLVTLGLTAGFLFFATFSFAVNLGKTDIAISWAIAIALCVSAVLSAAVRGLGRTLAGQMPDIVIRPTLFLAFVGLVVVLGLQTSTEQVLLLHGLAILAGLLFIFVVFAAKISLMAGDDSFRLDRYAWIRSMGQVASVAWFGVASAQVVVLLTAALADTAAVAGLRIAVQFSALMAVGLSAVEAVQAPRFAILYRDGAVAKIQSLVRTSSRASLAIALPVGVLLIAVPEKLLATLFSPEYLTVAQAISILAAGQLVNAFVGNVGTMLIACGYESLVVRVNAIAFLAILSGSLVLIPALGVNGAAISVSGSLALRNILCAIVAYRKMGIWSSPFAHAPARGTN